MLQGQFCDLAPEDTGCTILLQNYKSHSQGIIIVVMSCQRMLHAETCTSTSRRSRRLRMAWSQQISSWLMGLLPPRSPKRASRCEWMSFTKLVVGWMGDAGGRQESKPEGHRCHLSFSIYLAIYLSIYLSIFPSICLSIYLAIYPSIFVSLSLYLSEGCPATRKPREAHMSRVSESG